MGELTKTDVLIPSDVLDRFNSENIVSRIWNGEHTVWNPEPDEITNRLAWLESPQKMHDSVDEINAFVDELKAAGFTQALVLGMGGSSLAPEVFRKVFGVVDGFIDLAVLDSTDPGAVLSYERRLDFSKTIFIVSTKSGGTIETLSFFKYFYNRLIEELGSKKASEHFVAITDPGSALEQLAQALNFRNIFLNEPNIGGRFSVFSYFGLVPAAMVGVDISELLERALKMSENCRKPDVSSPEDNPGAWLGALLGDLAEQGRDKLTLISSPTVSPFGAWLEQLIAESTGKNGKGILPVDGEALNLEKYREDRVFIYTHLKDEGIDESKINALRSAGHPVLEIVMDDIYDLGAEFFRWEFATAVAGWRLGMNPFDQPNVESAKVQARKMVTAYSENGKLPDYQPAYSDPELEIYGDFEIKNLGVALEQFLSRTQSSGNEIPYVAIQAYLNPTDETDGLLQILRHKIRDRYCVATTVGFGPRFLHSTGQLHKGDAGQGLFLAITADNTEDIPIPDEPGQAKASMTFGVLKKAQALGDRQALIDAGRAVLWIHLKKSLRGALNRLIEVV